MKNIIFPLVLIFALMSCSEDAPLPVEPDPFVGSWVYSNPDLNLNMSFDVTEEAGELTFKNIDIEYPELQEPEALDCHIETHYRFAVNAGYEEIKIFGSGEEEWIIINMIHNRVHLKTRDIMDVYIMEVHTINQEPIILENQVFIKEE